MYFSQTSGGSSTWPSASIAPFTEAGPGRPVLFAFVLMMRPPGSTDGTGARRRQVSLVERAGITRIGERSAWISLDSPTAPRPTDSMARDLERVAGGRRPDL